MKSFQIYAEINFAQTFGTASHARLVIEIIRQFRN